MSPRNVLTFMRLLTLRKLHSNAYCSADVECPEENKISLLPQKSAEENRRSLYSALARPLQWDIKDIYKAIRKEIQ